MAAAVENDIEEFIQNQKAKLQQERQYLSVRLFVDCVLRDYPLYG